MTCHILNLISQLLSSLSSNNRNESSAAVVEVSKEEKQIVNYFLNFSIIFKLAIFKLQMIMVKLLPIFKMFISRHTTFDGIITDVRIGTSAIEFVHFFPSRY